MGSCITRSPQSVTFISMGSSAFVTVGGFSIPLRHRWMSAGNGGSAGDVVCCCSSHINRSATNLIVLIILIVLIV